MLVDALGNPLRILLSAGNEADISYAIPLLSGLVLVSAVIADKGYDSNELVKFIQDMGAQAVIPPRKNRKHQRDYDRHLYRHRHLVECFIGRLKRYRRVAIRYDKTDTSYLAFAHIAATFDLLR